MGLSILEAITPDRIIAIELLSWDILAPKLWPQAQPRDRLTQGQEQPLGQPSPCGAGAAPCLPSSPPSTAPGHIQSVRLRLSLQNNPAFRDERVFAPQRTP